VERACSSIAVRNPPHKRGENKNSIAFLAHALNLQGAWVMPKNASGAITVRLATQDDCDTILGWRNHPATRRHFFNSQTIAEEEHRRWFASVLADPARYLLVAQDASGDALGVMRFDSDDSRETAVVDIYLVPRRHGEGWGKPMLCAGIDWLRTHTTVRNLLAEGLPQNISSWRMFESAGFKLQGETFTLALGDCF
jgi:UDP-2,4-diacetamido-2,4,6-trideoxy-beta-L-altropyranose hydrolase